ncbi:MAG: hypothetical protein M3440_04175, partial [Chloroflexota bacterium]|nr:hypothetical protein [Chloroflexota bacterium]
MFIFQQRDAPDDNLFVHLVNFDTAAWTLQQHDGQLTPQVLAKFIEASKNASRVVPMKLEGAGEVWRVDRQSN